jgi:cytochrome c oxidase cbb3-type subunit III
MPRVLRLFICSTAIVGLLSLAICAQTHPPPPATHRGPESTHEFLGLGTPPDPKAAERGGKLFAANCVFCHGAKATGGDTGPDLVRSTLVLHDEKGSLIGPAVHDGRPARGMPAFAAFTPDQLRDISEFLHLRVELAANRGTYKISDVITGNAAGGQRYFNTDGGCRGCHSPTGDLAHIGSRLSPADLQQAFLYPESRDRQNDAPAPPAVKITLASGQQFTGRLRLVDDFQVAFTDDQGQFHSVALNENTRVEIEDKMAAHRLLLDKYTDTSMHNLTAYLVTLK